MELIWLSSAYLAGLICRQLYFPPLVGYLIAGYVLNSLGFKINDTLSHISDIGIELLLFTVGLKIKLRSLLRREVLNVGGLHLLIVTAVSVSVYFGFFQGHIAGGLVLGVSLAFSSTVLAVKVLEDSRELSTLYGRDVLSILILQDIVAIGLLAFTSGKTPTPWTLGLLFIPLLRPIAHRLLNASHDGELKLLLGISLALAGGMLAEHVGISNDIGALLTGTLLAGHHSTEELSETLWGLKETFLVAFFLQIGLANLPSYDNVLDALALTSLLSLQGGLFFILFILAGLRARTAFVSSLALMTYSEFSLITSNAVVEAGLLPDDWKSIIGLAVAISLAIAAPLNRFSHQLFSLLEKFLIRFERKSDSADRLPSSIGSTEWLIFGMGRTGLAAYLGLIRQNVRVLGLDADPIILENQLANGRRVIYGDAEDSELWEKIPLEKIKGIILTMPEFEVRCFAIKQLKQRQFSGHIGTVCFDSEEEQHLHQLGVNFIVHPLLEAGTKLAEQMLDTTKIPN